MNKATVGRYVAKLPFTPFRVRAADGSVFTIRHRDFVSVSTDGRELQIWTDTGMVVVDCLLISVIEEGFGTSA